MDEEPELRTASPLLGFRRRLGSGLVTGAADDGPSGIATRSQIGAQFGFGPSWTFVLSHPLTVVIQEIAAAIGCVTGRGIAHNLRRHYSPRLLRAVVTLLLVANIITSVPISAPWEQLLSCWSAGRCKLIRCFSASRASLSRFG